MATYGQLDGQFAGQFGEQFLTSTQDQFAKHLALIHAMSSTAFDGVQKLVALNINTVKQSIANSNATTHLLLNAKEAKDLFDLNATTGKPNLESILAYGRELAAISSDTRTEMLRVASDSSPFKFNAVFQYTPVDVSSVLTPNKIVDITPTKARPAALKVIAKPAAKTKVVGLKSVTKPIEKSVAKASPKASIKATQNPTPKAKQVTVKPTQKSSVTPKAASKPIVLNSAKKVAAPIANKARGNVPPKSAPTPIKPAKTIKQAAQTVGVKPVVQPATAAAKTMPKRASKPASKLVTKPAAAALVKTSAQKTTPTKLTTVKPVVIEPAPVVTPIHAVNATSATLAAADTSAVQAATEVTAKPAAVKFPFPATPKFQTGKPAIPGSNQKPAYKAKSSSATGAKKPVRQ